MKLYFGHTSSYPLPDREDEIRGLLGDYRAKAVLSNRTPSGRSLSFLAGMLLKKALLKEGIDITEADFRLLEHKKPCLTGADSGAAPHFSISHSGELALVAISDSPVGCDIQRIEKKKAEQCLKLARRFFTEGEMGALLAMSEDERHLVEAFHLIFSAKESFVKTTGDGLIRPLDSFELPPGPGGPFAFEDGGRSYDIWYFLPGDVEKSLPGVDFSGEYVAAVCKSRL